MPFDLWHHFVVTSIMYHSSKLFPDSKIAASFLFLSSYKLSILRCFLPLMAQLTFQEKQYIYVGRPLKQFLDDTITQTLKYHFFQFLGLFLSVYFLAVNKDLILEIKLLINKNQLSGLHNYVSPRTTDAQ